MNKVIQLIYDIVLYGLEKVGRYYSCYRAFVIDNEDPEGLSRLILRIPDLTGVDIHNKWAWPRNVFSGKDYGFQCIPEKKTMVWVEFENGDPQKPVWSHGYHGKNEKPEALKDIKNFWFKTPGGHLIELDDTKKELRITTTNNKTLIEKEGTWYFDGGNNEGLVIVQPLVDRLKKIESALKELQNNYLTHTHLDSDLLPTTPINPIVILEDVGTTNKSDLENQKVKH